MADVLRGGIVHCNDQCGCRVPCPGGMACRCAGQAMSIITRSALVGNIAAATPGTCSKIQPNKTGKAYCSCGTGCTCSTCNA